MRPNRDHLMRWRGEYWLVYITTPFSGKAGIWAGDRPSSTALGFENRPRGPFLRPEDVGKPSDLQRRDVYINYYARPMTRQILAESTLYQMTWRGIPLVDPEWSGPTPQGDTLLVRVDPTEWPSFAERDKAIKGLRDIRHIPRELLDAPENYFYSIASMLRQDGWIIYDARMQGLGAQTVKPINELDLVEVSWPKDMIDGLKE